MTGLSNWDPLSAQVVLGTFLQHGWILVFALVVGARQRTEMKHWYHLPLLCWGLVTAWQQLDFFPVGYLVGPGPPPVESVWISGYQNLLGLCGVCFAQVVGLSVAGKTGATLGTTGLRRVAMTCVLVAVVMDLFFLLWAIT